MPVIFFLLGLVFGSFFNAVIYRLPRKEYSINKPRRSICPECKHVLTWKDNIPLISYLLLKGKCRYCGAKISLRYPAVEVLTAFLFAINALFFPLQQAVTMCILVSGLIISSFIDLEHFMIPDTGIVLVATGAALYSFFSHQYPKVLIEAGIVTGLMIAFFAVSNAVRKDSFGFGDVELIAVLSLAVGLFGSLFVILFSSIFALLTYALIAAVKKKNFDRKTMIPFGPFISLGGYVTLLFMDQIRTLYGLN
ncbi:peptidase A24 [Kosmotoga arenicorallina S304]|uniref:Peptidase A24 n=1 Tax=Kosmotoga arenicorallina S304 TaxID=1453497 RepID=A0A176K0E3_9BACT|nr:A24 family peptidase [Kosmotoga arenicorallina]OAA29714.1 peptidase A24 [Kosmotoga arenicorallina S304]